MGFFKKMFGDAVDDLKKSFEDSKKEMLNSLSEAKKDALGSFTQKTSASKVVDDDDDDDEPRINMGKLVDGVLTISESFSELDDESLEDYKRLRQIVFPASLKKLDSDVICDQEKLEIVDFSKVTHLKEIPDDFISGETRIKEFVIPQGVTEVGDGFLGECGAGTKIFVPASIKKLGYINGNSNNDQFVYLFASNIDISDVEQDIKTLYVLPEFYGYYAKQLKECESEARLREMPAEMMDVYGANEPKQISETKQTTKPEPHKIIPSGVISTQNNELRDFKRKKMSDLREARDEKDRSRTPENMNKWKKVVADIEVIDTALKAGATTFGELKELAKDNASIIVEIDEIQASQLKAKQKQESQKKKEKVRVSFNINGEEGFTRITMYPLIGKECQQTLKNGVEHDRRTGAMEVSQDCIDKLSELLSEKDEQLPLEFLFAPVSTPTELIVTDEESDEEIYNEEYEINPRYGIMSMDEAVDNYEDEEGELKEYKEYLTDTAHTPDDNYISIGIAKTWDKLPESYIEGEGFVPSVIGETLKVASEDNIALLHGETGLSDSTITFILEIEDEFDPDKLDFINFDAEYGDVSSVLQETLAADFVSMNAIMYDGKMYFAQPQNMDLGENEGDDYYDIVNYHLEGDQEIDFESESELESEDKIVESSDKEEKVVKEVVSKIKQKLQSLGMSSFTLYGSDYEGDKEYEEVEQLGDDGLLESSSEYAINYNDSYNGFSSVYTKVRKINIQDGNVLFDLEEIYEDNNGEYESKGYYADQSIDRILSTCKKDTVESGFERILNYLSDETLIKLNKGIDSEADSVLQDETKIESKSVPESKTEVGSGLFSARLEALISSALQDGVLTDQEKAILKKRAEAEGEDWDEVEMIINARLAERHQVENKNIEIENNIVVMPHSVNTSPNSMHESIDNTSGEGYYIKKGKRYIIPISKEIIKEGEFENNNSIEKVVFPSSLVKIESYAFNNCSHLVELDFSQCLKLKEIGESAFQNCGLRNIDLSKCMFLETIGELAFCGCKSLMNIEFPNSLCDLGGLAFGCNVSKRV